MGAAYPGTLPALDFSTLSVARSPNTIRSATDRNPGKARRRYTSAPRVYTQTYRLNETQLITFDSFFENTLASGTLPFDHPEPVDGGTVECRFTETPTFRLVGHHSDPGRRYWEGPVSFEVLG